ncbi:hypothetical protein [Pedobacter deserti]|uniref:hypothetical protein n=1 Tax=Pedobacter deserti TaxID=2817382 RepID=UPI002108B597|nr:hypothetical protein [Pedobacter sp. SYSU D00382]
MGKEKSKHLAKDAKKVLKIEIEASLFSALKASAEKFVPASKKVDKAIRKEVRKLTKVIAKNASVKRSASAPIEVEPQNLALDGQDVPAAAPKAARKVAVAKK